MEFFGSDKDKERIINLFMNKQIHLKKLKEIIKEKNKKKVVITGGVFKFLEPWHIDLFDFAKSRGDILIVIIFPEKTLIPEKERVEILSAIAVIDYIVPLGKYGAENVFTELGGADIFVLNREITSDYSDMISNLKREYF